MKHFIMILFISLFVYSCKTESTEQGNDHGSEEKLQLTSYSSNIEVFAELDPFVKGQNSGILSHFTWLDNFKPLEEGEITISLIIGNKGIKQTLLKPTRNGIYSFDITPDTEGKGQIIFDIKTEKGDFQVVVPGVTVYSTEKEAYDAADKAIVSKTNTTVFTQEQSWKIDFGTELPISEPFGQVIKTTAQVLSAQGDEILVSAKTNGMVLFLADNVLEGKSVSNGQVLFSISGSGLSENNSAVRFVEAKSNFEKAKAEYERAKELAKDKIVSEKDLQKAKDQYDNAKAVYDNLSNNFNASGQNVSSPMTGFVKQLFVQNGQYVEVGQPIVSVSQNKTLLLRAEVQQKYAPILSTISTANIRTLQDNSTYTLEQLNGRVVSFGKSTNNDNYLIPISFEIDNKGSFVSGGFVELYIKTLTNSMALTIPISAIMEEQGNYFVYVQITPELFEKREVKIGATDGLKVEIQSGLSSTERVVTKGAILIKLAQATGTLDAHSGHVH
jgi:cobalt-zinc-cadmium efflux system membrane fusion protein